MKAEDEQRVRRDENHKALLFGNSLDQYRQADYHCDADHPSYQRGQIEIAGIPYVSKVSEKRGQP